MGLTFGLTDDRRRELRWVVLALVVSAEFVVFLDIAVVNVALPTITERLGLDQRFVSLVVDAYQVVFGGLLLLGGRIADAVGRKQVFLVGFGVFTLASLLAGLASEGLVLVVARGLQGLGAALLVPATTALIVAVFTDGDERGRAFGIWGAMRAGGASLGAALGGIITQLLGWEWVFLINIPIGVVVLLAGPILLPELPRDSEARPGVLAGATVTVGLLLASTALIEGPVGGWLSTPTIAMAVAAVATLSVFVATQRRSERPLVPRRVLTGSVLGSTTASLLYGAAHIPFFLLLSFYLQDSLQMSAFEAGAAMLPIGVVVMASSTLLVPRVLRRTGARATLATGLLLLSGGMLILAAAPPDGSYVVAVLPAGLVAALGLSFCFTGVTLPAVESVADRDTGIASGMVNSAQRVGSGVGVATLVALPALGPHPQSLPLAGGAALAVLGILVALVVLPRPVRAPRPDGAESPTSPAPTSAGVESASDRSRAT